MRGGPLEITDLLWSFDHSGARAEVVQAEAVELLQGRGQRHAARLVARMPATDGVLDTAEVDALGIRIHCELQRLGEELQLGRRVAAWLGRRFAALDGGPIRLVDVGCGLGQVLRLISHERLLPPNVDLVGVDLNPVLTREADRLARAERLTCRFVTGDALAPGVAIEDGPRTVVISSGLLHHLDQTSLRAFFAAQAGLGVRAFAHWDIAPSTLSTIGAWIFHRARMREPVSRHDGVLSARRAHSAEVLMAAARHGAPSYEVEVPEGSRWHPGALDVLRPLVGTRA